MDKMESEAGFDGFCVEGEILNWQEILIYTCGKRFLVLHYSM